MLAVSEKSVEFSLHDLLHDIVNVDENLNRSVTGLALDSRTVNAGDLFIACVGTHQDARNYIDEAISRGAVAVLCEAQQETESCTIKENTKTPVISLKNLQHYIGDIAARFYHHPSQQLTVIGFTGTNGKTSCSNYVASCLQTEEIPCGVIGTIGYGFPPNLKEAQLTTPDAITLQKQLADLLQQGAKAVAMEVSSHSLVQERVQGIDFKIAVFTNLTRDHLDYHGTIENYAKAKQKLFFYPGLQNAVINLDDAYGRQFLAELPKSVQPFGYTLEKKTNTNIPTVFAHHIKLSSNGFTVKVNTPWGNGEIKSQLLGRFNISNLLAVLTTLNILKVPFAKSLQLISQLHTVPGRMQVYGGGKLPTVVIDYAHTPDALEQALNALREHCKGHLWCVFGCGGDRDRGKRPMMGRVAERCSDRVVITDDNPRTEQSPAIIKEIVAGLLCPWAAEIIPDRHGAIAYAIQSAEPGDIVLIAGKGHEPFQIVGTKKLPFSDAEQVQLQLSLR